MEMHKHLRPLVYTSLPCRRARQPELVEADAIPQMSDVAVEGRSEPEAADAMFFTAVSQDALAVAAKLPPDQDDGDGWIISSL